MKNKVSISIVTYNDENHIGNLLDSLHENVKQMSCDIYVIDNGSTDNTIEIVKNGKWDVTLIDNKQNVGFGAGHNKVLPFLDSQYHAYINPDIVIDTDIFAKMAEYLDANSDIGIVVPKILYPNGELQILPKRDPKLIYILARRINIKPLHKCRAKYEMLDIDLDVACDIEFATGCFMFVRTDLLKKVGGFDERYFLYFEDADLTRSIRQFARTQYNPQFIAYHHWDRGGARNLKLFLIQIQSMLKYMEKWKFHKNVKKSSNIGC